MVGGFKVGKFTKHRSLEMTDFTVKDMTCGHCASTITRAVKEVDPDARCEIDLEKKQVLITSGKPAAEFLEAIQEAGYNPAVGGASGS